MSLLFALLGGVPGWIWGLLGVAGASALAYLKGRSHGARLERLRDEARAAESLRDAIRRQSEIQAANRASALQAELERRAADAELGERPPAPEEAAAVIARMRRRDGL